MARPPRESASESESKPVTGRAATKAKTTAAQLAQQEFLSKHITSNGVKDKPAVSPLDFETYPLESLIKYNSKYKVADAQPYTINGYMLQLEIGKKTFSCKKSANRISKKELAGAVKQHFVNMSTRENEIVTNFLYKVGHQEQNFKLTLK